MRFALCTLGIALFVAPLALAQNAASTPAPACDGNYNIVRISDIAPGKFEEFTQAVAAQAAWYKSKGSNDQILLLRVYERDSNGMKPSEAQAITFHISAPGQASSRPAHDPGYDAFVKLFRDSSTIKSENLTCMPKIQ